MIDIKVLCIASSAFLLSSCMSPGKFDSPFESSKYTGTGAFYQVNRPAEVVMNVLNIDYLRFSKGKSSYINWKSTGIQFSAPEDYVIDPHDIAQCFQHGCGNDGRLNALRLYILYYAAEASGANPNDVYDGWWWDGKVINKKAIDALSDYGMFKKNYERDYRFFKLPDFTAQELDSQLKLTMNFVSGIQMAVEKKRRGDLEKKRIDSESKPTSIRSKLEKTDKDSVDAIIDLINSQSVVFSREKDADGYYSGGYNRVSVNGRDLPGSITPEKMTYSIFNSVFQCQPPGTYINYTFEYNYCVSLIAKGIYLWISATKDPSISDSSFKAAFDGSYPYDFGWWALKAYQYKKLM